jgi:hypothetical protein
MKILFFFVEKENKIKREKKRIRFPPKRNSINNAYSRASPRVGGVGGVGGVVWRERRM